MNRFPEKAWQIPAAISLAVLLSGVARPETEVPADTGKPLFSFAVFSDNRQGHPVLQETLKTLRDRVKPRFYLGVGDHLDSKAALKTWEAMLTEVFGTPQSFYKHFYPTIGDNEDRHFGPDSKCRPDTALNAGWYERALVARRDGTPLRSTIKACHAPHGDYYAVVEEEGIRIHLVSVYFTDEMKKAFPESVTFCEETCRKVLRDHPGEPLIVWAHEGEWWKRLKLPPTSPIFGADLVLEASYHSYQVRDEAPPGPLVFNTSAVEPGMPGHVFEVKVFKDRFVVLALETPHCRLGPYELQDWRKVWVKPFGKKARPVLKWEDFCPLAGDAAPTADQDGFNRERVLFTARSRQVLSVPAIAQLRAELASENAETKAIALLTLGYLADSEVAAALLQEHLGAQPRVDLRAHAVVSLLRTHPREALPMLAVIIDAGKESLLRREDFETISRQRGAPERLPALLACTRSKSGLTAYLAMRAMRRLGPEAGPAVPRLIEVLGEEIRDRYLVYRWLGACQALGAIGPASRPALPVMVKRLDRDAWALSEAILQSLPKIGGPEVRHYIPRVRELANHKHPVIAKAARECLKLLGVGED